VFLVNSRLGLVCATVSSSGCEIRHPTAVVLLPKLRTQFAEFLNQGSLDRLRILYVSTCVGLGYGHLHRSLEAFLGSIGSLASPERLGVVPQDMAPRICLGDLPTHLPQDDQRLGRATFLRPPIAGLVPGWSVAPEGVPLVPWIRPGRDQGGTGISTSRPSPTSVDLGLGPD
jgi:hypothetical protein